LERRSVLMFDQAEFEKALATPRLRQPLPEFLPGNRGGGKVRVLAEPELNAMTRQWFVDYERKIQYYAEHGIDVGWTLEWSKKYWWSWLMRDMSLNDELYEPDLRYKDVSTLGRILVGLDEFVKYNFAFFDAIPDWRYDPLPGQIYLDFTPEGEVRIVVRYIGSGHWTGPLRLYPYDETAPAIQGTGLFVQCTAIDRYHFNQDRRMYEGETLFDAFDATQSAGILPRDDSWQFHALMKATKLLVTLRNIRQRAPLLHRK
jgi:hypothetical protein